MIVSRMVRGWVAAGMLVAALVGCATTETQPSAAVTSLSPNAQQWFRINWKAEPDRDAKRLEWRPEVIPALGRVYFEIPKMPPAAQYRVTVWAYDRIKGGGSG